ncbi:MAG: hypothetical protein RIA71_08240 [Oceanicaulis sp.]
MITYHPFYDVDHTIFRLLSVFLTHDGIELERAQLYDFFLVFPHALADVTLPHTRSQRVRKHLKLIPKPYQRLPDSRVLFRRGAPLQHQAARLLIAAGALHPGEERQPLLYAKKDVINARLSEQLVEFSNRKHVEFLILDEIKDLPVHGPKGLKARSNLLEYSYDASAR